MQLIGITGGIGSGKSTVASAIAAFGYPVYNSDIQAQNFLDTDNVIRQLRKKFGDDIFTDKHRIDRKKLAKKVFNDKKSLTFLNELIHPLVIADFITTTKQWNEAGYTLGFMESAIIYEAKIEYLFNKIIEVKSTEQLVVHRLQTQRRLSFDDIQQRMSNQNSVFTKANYVIYNDEYHSIIQQLDELILHLAQSC